MPKKAIQPTESVKAAKEVQRLLQLLPNRPEMGTGTIHFDMNYTHYTASEMAILRRSAAQWKGSFLPKSIGARLRLCFEELQVLRNAKGQVAGFGGEGFVLTPKGAGLYFWGEERARQAHINA